MHEAFDSLGGDLSLLRLDFGDVLPLQDGAFDAGRGRQDVSRNVEAFAVGIEGCIVVGDPIDDDIVLGRRLRTGGR